MKELFENNSQCIRVYLGKETIQDPFEKNTTIELFAPILIKAIVSDLVASQITWKIPGVNTSKAKDLMIEKKNRTLLENSQKIEVKENNTWIEFQAWKDSGRMQIREEGQFLRVYIYAPRH